MLYAREHAEHVSNTQVWVTHGLDGLEPVSCLLLVRSVEGRGFAIQRMVNEMALFASG